jgi:hypothetical protein
MEVNSDSAAVALVQFVKDNSIDVLIVSMGRPKGTMGRLNPIQSRTTDYIASHSPCATLVIHPQVRRCRLQAPFAPPTPTALKLCTSHPSEGVPSASSKRTRQSL